MFRNHYCRLFKDDWDFYGIDKCVLQLKEDKISDSNYVE